MFADHTGNFIEFQLPRGNRPKARSERNGSQEEKKRTSKNEPCAEEVKKTEPGETETTTHAWSGRALTCRVEENRPLRCFLTRLLRFSKGGHGAATGWDEFARRRREFFWVPLCDIWDPAVRLLRFHSKGMEWAHLG